MDIKDFEKVTKLINTRNKLQEALDSTESYFNIVYESPEAGNTCFLSSTSDGSGPRVSMRGCYVGKEMVEAAMAVIADKMVMVDAQLQELGVKI